MDKIYYFDYNFEGIGSLFLYSKDEKLVKISFNKLDQSIDNLIKEEIDFLSSAKSSIDQYLKGETKTFDIDTEFIFGTKFQQHVWNGLLKIPYGTTISYRGFAELLNKPTGQRAVANANSKNPLPIVFPCHRVIRANGGLGGYLGGYLGDVSIKQQLLTLEKNAT